MEAKNLTCMPCEDRMLGLILHDRKLSVRVKKTGNRKLIAFMGILRIPILGHLASAISVYLLRFFIFRLLTCLDFRDIAFAIFKTMKLFPFLGLQQTLDFFREKLIE